MKMAIYGGFGRERENAQDCGIQCMFGVLFGDFCVDKYLYNMLNILLRS